MTEQREAVPKTNRRKRANGPSLPRDEASRQGEITATALSLMGKDNAIQFLNSENVNLGGRPIALATASKEGLARVIAEIAAQTANAGDLKNVG